ncbi:uncharacterized protein [Epargyreus clarus]|uniref:uncharacterized protein n=1 Tax=Epargyreus clarus TaxID=520877 RepID=UPI003C2CD0EF
MLHSVRNKLENCQYLDALEYFKDTENNDDSPLLKPDDQVKISLEVEKGPENAKDRVRIPKNYCISPINPEESDADLSDGDPTFIVQEDKRVNNMVFSPSRRSSSSSSSSSSTSRSSSSSSDSSSDESVLENNDNNKENATPDSSRTPQQEQESTSAAVTVSDGMVIVVRGRKRTRQPENWKQIKAKKLRNLGKTYINSKNAIIAARHLKPPCNDKCRLQCPTKIDSVQRQSIFDTYREIGNIHNQRSFILSCLTNITPKYKYTNALAPRRCNKAFNFIVDGRPIRVCKTFFLNTLDISDRMIRTIKSKTDEHGILKADFRGMTASHVSDEALISDIKEFINSIPRTDSHYTRETSAREFIDGGKTIVELFKDFEDIQKQKK